MTLKPLQIGSLCVPLPVVLAPMAGYTDHAFRVMCKRHGCPLVFTEVVNAEGVVRGASPTLHLLHTTADERPIAAHLYGARPETMARAAAAVERMGGFDFIDINCGCPVRKIVAKGAGVALMASPEKIAAIVRAIRQAVSLPVTLKTRLGLTSDRRNLAEVAAAAAEAGASAIFIHGRVATERHSGPVDWDTIAAVKAQLKIPVIGNGGLETAEDALATLRRTGLDGVMLGRAAVGNPWIFDDIAAVASGKPVLSHTPREHRETILEHLERLVALKRAEPKYRKRPEAQAEAGAALQFRAHLIKYMAGFQGSVTMRRHLSGIRTVEDVIYAVDWVLAGHKGDTVPRPGGPDRTGLAEESDDVESDADQRQVTASLSGPEQGPRGR